jgi:pectate lyase
MGFVLPSRRELEVEDLPLRALPNFCAAALLLLVPVATVAACRDLNIDRFRGAGEIGDESVRVVIDNDICPSDEVGAATVAGSTTGGGMAVPVTVTTLSDLIAYAKRTKPTIVRVKGMIAVPAGSHPFQILVESNKTIVGIDAKSGLVGGGLLIHGAQNVIVRNLVIERPVGTDAITVSAASHIWIDHCELFGDTEHNPHYYGWLIDTKDGSNFITVSWNWFHDHFNTIQVGDSDRDGRKGTERLTVTLHHNLFQRTASGAPQVRFGMVHVFNNYYQDVAGYAIASLRYSQVAVEENVFENVTSPLTDAHGSLPPWRAGQIEDLGNSYDSSCVNAVMHQRGRAFTFMPSNSYSYLADATSAVPVMVGACAGPGTIQNSTNHGPSDPIASEDAVRPSRSLQP